MTSWPHVLETLVDGTDLDERSARWAMAEILAGDASSAQIAGFAVALRAKGISAAELVALTDALYDAAVPISIPGPSLDIVGTGGDRSFSVNISTMAALVAAGAGAKIVKHGNRSASSKAGSADVIEALGVPLDLPAERVAAIAEEAGITFCFAAAFHPAMRFAGPPRRELGIATAFNFLGPMSNPARPTACALGCADPTMLPVIADVFAARGVDAWVFRGDDGLDELTTTAGSQVFAVKDGSVTRFVLDPGEVGLELVAPEALRGGDVHHNADVVRRTLAGETGAVRDAVVLNAGAGLAIFEPTSTDPIQALAAGMLRASAAIDSGAAAAALERWSAAAQRP